MDLREVVLGSWCGDDVSVVNDNALLSLVRPSDRTLSVVKSSCFNHSCVVLIQVIHLYEWLLYHVSIDLVQISLDCCRTSWSSLLQWLLAIKYFLLRLELVIDNRVGLLIIATVQVSHVMLRCWVEVAVLLKFRLTWFLIQVSLLRGRIRQSRLKFPLSSAIFALQIWILLIVRNLLPLSGQSVKLAKWVAIGGYIVIIADIRVLGSSFVMQPLVSVDITESYAISLLRKIGMRVLERMLISSTLHTESLEILHITIMSLNKDQVILKVQSVVLVLM